MWIELRFLWQPFSSPRAPICGLPGVFQATVELVELCNGGARFVYRHLDVGIDDVPFFRTCSARLEPVTKKYFQQLGRDF